MQFGRIKNIQVNMAVGATDFNIKFYNRFHVEQIGRIFALAKSSWPSKGD
jgi:hypothetical protein